MVDIFTESEMDFISDNAFYIEKSKLYTDIGKGIRSVEFVRVMDSKLLFVEARQTFPNPENTEEGNLDKYNAQIEEICEKFIHSLSLLSSVKVGVARNRFTDDFSLNGKLSLVFVFVIKNHQTKWCRRIRKKFIDTLPEYLVTIWEPVVYVINHNTAVKHGLAVG